MNHAPGIRRLRARADGQGSSESRPQVRMAAFKVSVLIEPMTEDLQRLLVSDLLAILGARGTSTGQHAQVRSGGHA